MFLHDVHADLRILRLPRDSVASISRSRNYSNSNSSSSSSNLWSLRRKWTEPATEVWIPSASKVQRKTWYMLLVVFFTASIITKIHHVHYTQPKQKFTINIQYCPFLKKHLTTQIHLLNVKGKINLELTNLKPLDSDVINKFMYWYTCIKTSVKKHSFEFLKEKIHIYIFSSYICKLVNINAQNVYTGRFYPGFKHRTMMRNNRRQKKIIPREEYLTSYRCTVTCWIRYI